MVSVEPRKESRLRGRLSSVVAIAATALVFDPNQLRLESPASGADCWQLAAPGSCRLPRLPIGP